MTDNPYIIPDDRYYTVNFSGGRSSAFMLRQILDANHGIPENAFVVFCNTGKERPETLDFVHKVGENWGIDITWLEYRYLADAKGGRWDPKNHYEVVYWHTASRAGEPFEQLIKSKRLLPNPVTRLCTSELKVKTVDRWLRRTMKIDSKNARNILGIRFDERRRWEKALLKHCDTIYPMVYAKHTKRDVDEFWEFNRKHNGFDLTIPSTHGNCDLCFLKRKKALIYYIAEEPELAQWWADMEAFRIESKGEHIRNERILNFNKEYSYAELVDEALTQPDMFLESDAIFEKIDCFCGD